MVDYETFKKNVSVESVLNLDKELEVFFDRCFLTGFYIEPSFDNKICQFIANFKNGSSYSYIVTVETLIKVFIEESFGKAFNTYIRPLPFEKI